MVGGREGRVGTTMEITRRYITISAIQNISAMLASFILLMLGSLAEC